MARFVTFLASRDSDYITGQALNVYGRMENHCVSKLTKKLEKESKSICLVLKTKNDSRRLLKNSQYSADTFALTLLFLRASQLDINPYLWYNKTILTEQKYHNLRIKNVR